MSKFSQGILAVIAVTALALGLVGSSGVLDEVSAFSFAQVEGDGCVPVPEFDFQACPLDPTTTTTTLPPTTTTTLPPLVFDQCIADQIERDKFKQNGTPKNAFDWLTMNKDTGQQWFDVSYDTNLDNGVGWISGDKRGYVGLYSHLVDLNEKAALGRVTFSAISGAAYTKVNDAFMDEIQTTLMGYDGTCASAGEAVQGQNPLAAEAYEPNTDPDERLVVTYNRAGVPVETRDYGDLILTPDLKLRDGGYIEEPFTQLNGLGTDPHTVYERQIIILDVQINGVWNPALVIYYDVLHPSVELDVWLSE